MAAGSAGSDPAASYLPGMVQVSAEKQQLIGVRIDEVKRSSATQLLRVPGRVAADEQRLYRLTAGVDGWIRELGNNSAGSFVKKDQVLATYYTPNLVSDVNTFAIAQSPYSQTSDSTKGIQIGAPSLRYQLALDSLRTLGMSESQIEEVQRTRKIPTQIRLYSPINGFVIARNISHQQRFDKSMEMYRIADLSHVWVLADIFERDREFVRPGSVAKVHYQGRDFQARMSDALPQFDPQSRTLKARFELDNPGNVLLPDMFVDVELHAVRGAAVTVSTDSVIDSGRRKIVYVECSNGTFEPRLVQTGWVIGDRVQITKGLEPGERIVVSGNFLIDSETRMKTVTASSAPFIEKITAAKDPVCGMDLDPKAPDAIRTHYGGKSFYFCSVKCKKDFEANLGKYVHENRAIQDINWARGQ
jgi:multidrug efflux pump subunit AcrA (membrane-fusion protein)/YHS domain-containing protein